MDSLNIPLKFKKLLSQESLDINSWLKIFRYGSLFITSVFYFAGPPPAPWYLKISVSVCLLIEALVFFKVYEANGGKYTRKVLITIETVGLAMLLIITGGLDSPFLWYAVNPILMAATLLPIYFCWGMAAGFLTMAFTLHPFRLYSLEPSASLWSDSINFILIFILITLAAQLFSRLISKLSYQTGLAEKQIEHIKSLYEAVEVLSLPSSPKEIIDLFASYSKALTGAVKVIIWAEIDFGFKEPHKNILYAIRGPRNILAEETWSKYIRQLFENRGNVWKIDVFSPEGSPESNGTLLTVQIRSNSKNFGLLSTFYQGRNNLKEVEKTLYFLADLCACILERRAIEVLAEEFALAEEKNRIAGEIHDKVTQNVFGLIHGLGLLIKQENLAAPVKQRARVMQQTAQQCLRDLRDSIYSMSSVKNKAEPFADELNRYLYNLGQINDVNVEFTCKGSLHQLTPSVCNSLNRMIREATANSIRHSFCNNIQASLNFKNGETKLVISDDGIGFNPEAINNGAKSGLGLINMQEQARILGGDLFIDSTLGKGTTVYFKTSGNLYATPSSSQESTVECRL